jgi:serine/threonine protein kinase
MQPVWSDVYPTIDDICEGRPIARGIDFDVFRVELGDGSEIAVKVASSRQSAKPAVQRWLLEHHQRLRRIISPHIIVPKATLPRWGNRIGYAMDFYSSGPIACLLKSQLTHEARRDLTRQIATGLQDIQRASGAHGDLHLGNILTSVDPERPSGHRVVLIDPGMTGAEPEAELSDLVALARATRLLGGSWDAVH